VLPWVDDQGGGLRPRLTERQTRIRGRLRELLQGPGAFDIVEASLLVAAEEYPDLEVEREAARIPVLGREAARRVQGLTNPFARLDALRSFLFDDLGFRGNTVSYDDPRNCYLNEVLIRRTGIPLTLSIVFVEVARRAGFDAVGIGLPGHFVVKVMRDGREILVDPFHGGHVITEDDCRTLVTRATGRPAMFRRAYLAGASERVMLKRLLLNLKRVHLAREDHRIALGVVDRLLLLSPDDPREIRDRGLVLAHLGRPGAAVADLEAYLQLVPAAPDAASVRGRLAWLRRRLTEIN
jgi:regulator of sirC expression with transglutaminase-like and TPR domain